MKQTASSSSPRPRRRRFADSMCHCGAVTELDENGSCEDCSNAYTDSEHKAALRRYRLRLVALVEHDATKLFCDEGVDWHYCLEFANFSHRDACEFLLHVPQSPVDLMNREAELARYGCTDALIQLLRGAHEVGAVWLLLYA